MNKARNQLARRSRRRSRRHHAFAAASCATMPRGTRNVLGTVAGAAAGLLAVGTGFFAVTTKDRALQKAAGAPSPKPGVATAALGVAAAVGGAFGGRYIATRKPTC
jgi:hypothetical protein